MKKKQSLATKDRAALLLVLQDRFEKNMQRHSNIKWKEVQKRIEKNESAAWSLSEMERTGGEPDVIGVDVLTGQFVFSDCSAESPSGRRSLCYDLQGQESRKDIQPVGNAVDMAAAMGASLLTEEEYRSLQQLGSFDQKTSSWILTPPEIRKLGGALFCDRRYNQVFLYHNGAQSFYAARGFRCRLTV